MKHREQVVFDIGKDKFKYLQREDSSRKNRADIIELNKRLNHSKKSNYYTNAKIVVCASMCMFIIALISLKF